MRRGLARLWALSVMVFWRGVRGLEAGTGGFGAICQESVEARRLRAPSMFASVLWGVVKLSLRG